jgi:periplasmic divalent cation tolerance protein
VLYLVTTTVERAEDGTAIARALVEGRLAACVQVVGPIESTYRWDGEVRTSTEWLCVAKTTAGQVDAAVDAVGAAHPYDLPEFMAVASDRVDPRYLAWATSEVGSRQG